MADLRMLYRREMRPLLMAALESDQLRHWSAGFLTVSGRRLDDRMKDSAILTLERYLVDHNDLPGHALDLELLMAFAEEVRAICHDETLSLRVNYNGVAWLLDAWRFLAHSGRLTPHDPRVILPACAVVGTGVHAVAFLSIAEGTRILMHLASSVAWPVREAVAVGLQQMLAEDWDGTMYELRRYVHIGEVHQHRAAALAVAAPELLRSRAKALDALDLHHAILAAYRRLPRAARHDEAGRALADALSASIGVLLLAERQAGFAAARTWLAWDDPDIQTVVRHSVASQPLASYAEAVYLRQSHYN